MAIQETLFLEVSRSEDGSRIFLETPGGHYVVGLKTNHPKERILSFKIGGSPDLLGRDAPKDSLYFIEGSAVGLNEMPLLFRPNKAFVELEVEPGAPCPQVWLLCSIKPLNRDGTVREDRPLRPSHPQRPDVPAWPLRPKPAQPVMDRDPRSELLEGLQEALDEVPSPAGLLMTDGDGRRWIVYQVEKGPEDHWKLRRCPEGRPVGVTDAFTAFVRVDYCVDWSARQASVATQIVLE